MNNHQVADATLATYQQARSNVDHSVAVALIALIAPIVVAAGPGHGAGG